MLLNKKREDLEQLKENYTGDRYNLKYDDRVLKLYKKNDEYIISEAVIGAYNGLEHDVYYMNYYFDSFPTLEEINKIGEVVSHINEFELLKNIKSIMREDFRNSEKTIEFFTTITFEDGEKLVWHSCHVDHYGISHTLKGVDGIVWKNGENYIWKDFIYEKGYWDEVRELTEREKQTYLILRNKITL